MKVLVAPLNWGLGHATRDIPIIRELLSQGAEVIIASDGPALALLRKEFPQLRSFELPCWNVTYPKSRNFVLHLFLQSGKVWRAIRREQRAIEKIVSGEGVNVVISDNRLGCFSVMVKSVVISHQLFIKSPVLQGFINWYNHRLLRKFSEVWIADVPGENNLSGELSAAEIIPFNHRHLGVISRFSPNDLSADEGIVAIISGPEPQRSEFENELLPKLKALDRKVSVLLGKPNDHSPLTTDGKLTLYPHLQSNDIENLLSCAEYVISRSGYTTVMDLVTLGKKAILVPTPGQPEQEYLANYYSNKNWFVIQQQGSIDLESGIADLYKKTLPKFYTKSFLKEAIQSLFEKQ